MKFTIAAITLACAFAAEDTTPPVISLDLSSTYDVKRTTILGDGSTQTIHNCAQTSHKAYAGGVTPCTDKKGAFDQTGGINTDGTARDYGVGANSAKATTTGSDYAKKCDVCATSGITACQLACPSPTASAYDHHEGSSLTVTTACKQYVVSPAGKVPYKDAAACTVTNGLLDKSAYDKRGEFVLSYDAADASGNDAETLVFAMVMVDHVAPTFDFAVSQMTVTSSDSTTASASIEACLPPTTGTNSNAATDRCKVKGFEAAATDNYDGTSLSLFTADGSAYVANADDVELSSSISSASDTATATYVAADFADIFGTSNANNEITLTLTLNIVDTTKPRVIARPLSTGSTRIAACSSTAMPASVNSLLKCALFNAERYVPKFTADSAVANAPAAAITGGTLSNAACGGCVLDATETGLCYTAGSDASNQCAPVGFKEDGDVTLNEFWECGRAITEDSEVFSATGTPEITGAYCVDDNDSAGQALADATATACTNCNGASQLSVTATAPQVSGSDVDFINGAKGTAADGTTYSIAYGCTDTANLASYTVTRTITIQDSVAPSLSITSQELRQSITETTNYAQIASDDVQCHDCTTHPELCKLESEVTDTTGCTVVTIAATSTEAEKKLVPMLDNVNCCVGSTASTANKNAIGDSLKSLCDAGIKADEQSCQANEHNTVIHSAGYTRDAASIEKLETKDYGYFCSDACVADSVINAAPSSSGNAGMTFQWYFCGVAGADLPASSTSCCNAGNTDVLTKANGDELTKKTSFETLKVGWYALKYTCSDGVQEKTACRTVLNEDHAKPIIDILGNDEETFEASSTNNYVDSGATCWDEVDGNISEDVEVSGDVVNLARVGVYMIMYDCTDSSGRTATQATRKVTVQDTVCPTCKFTAGATTQQITLEASFPYTDPFETDVVCTDTLSTTFSACAAGSTDTTCIKATTTKKDSTTEILSSTVTTQTGVYYTTYTVTDDVGNTNKYVSTVGGVATGETASSGSCTFDDATYTAASYTRTITVKDTLRPVITLKQGTDIIKTGAKNEWGHHADITADAAAVQGMTMGSTFHTNPSLMAEESQESVNGWVLGAIASAVSGLALLGYSLRKQAQPVATSVPV